MKISYFVLFLFSYYVVGAQVRRDSSIYRFAQQMQHEFQLSDSAVRQLTIVETQKSISLDSLRINHSISSAARTAFTQRVVEQYERSLKDIFSNEQWVQYLQKKEVVRQRFLAAAQAKHMTVREIIIPN